MLQGAEMWLLDGASVYVAGCRDVVLGRILKKMFETPYFRCVVVPDADTVEICGALKVRHYHISCSLYLRT